MAVGYAASPLVNMVFERVFFATPIARRLALGGSPGLLGVVLNFWREFADVAADSTLVVGTAFTSAAVISSCLSNMIVARKQRRSLNGFGPIAIAMSYGALTASVAVFALGRPPTVPWSSMFAVALLYLSLFGSVIAFGACHALLARIGAARASYVGVMATVVALAVSPLFEGFDWQPATVCGVAFAIIGNALALNVPRRPAASLQSTP